MLNNIKMIAIALVIFSGIMFAVDNNGYNRCESKYKSASKQNELIIKNLQDKLNFKEQADSKDAQQEIEKIKENGKYVKGNCITKDNFHLLRK